jgi:hypothetical protein
MREPERPGAVSQKMAVKRLRMLKRAEKRREATDALREEEEVRAAQGGGQEGDDEGSGSPSGGREGYDRP